jgi:hypothetical protein
MSQFKSVSCWACKLATRSLLLVGATALLVPFAVAPLASAQITIGVGVNPPVCSYGYYDYSPYGCAPMGFYGPGYFYNGIFLGVGPWAHWGYGHGWGGHRFSASGGGRYRGEGYVGAHGNAGGHGYPVNHAHGSPAVHAAHVNGGAHAEPAHGGASHAAPHAAPAHSGASHGGEHN